MRRPYHVRGAPFIRHKSAHSCNVRAGEVEGLSVQCFCEGFVKVIDSMNKLTMEKTLIILKRNTFLLTGMNFLFL